MVHLEIGKAKITILNCTKAQCFIMHEHIQFPKFMSKPYDMKSIIGYANLES